MIRSRNILFVLGLVIAGAPACMVSGSGTMRVSATPVVYNEPPAEQVEEVTVRPGYVGVKGRWDCAAASGRGSAAAGRSRRPATYGRRALGAARRSVVLERWLVDGASVETHGGGGVTVTTHTHTETHNRPPHHDHAGGGVVVTGGGGGGGVVVRDHAAAVKAGRGRRDRRRRHRRAGRRDGDEHEPDVTRQSAPSAPHGELRRGAGRLRLDLGALELAERP